MRQIPGALVAACLILAGCEFQVRDYSQLPDDPAERATICFGAAVLHAEASGNLGLDTNEEARRNGLRDRMRSATEFAAHVGEDERGAVQLRIRRWADQGNWLPDLNRCITGYDLGEPEPLPELPRDPAERLYVCGIATAVKARGSDVEARIDPLLDPQGFHFYLQLGKRFGDETRQRMNAQASALSVRTLWQGAVDHFVDRCIAEHPRAALDHRTDLPGEEPLRAEICAEVADILVEDSRANRMRAAYLPRRTRIVGPVQAVLSEHNPGGRPAMSDAEIDPVLAELGPSTSIFTACEQAYLGGS